MINSCTFNFDNTKRDQQPTYSPPLNPNIIDTSNELTLEQQSAFDAFNKLQVNIKQDHLYSTFVNAPQLCYPPDSNFIISRAELLSALKHLLITYPTNSSIEEQNEMVETAVLAQEEYLVLLCFDKSPNQNIQSINNSSFPTTGVWILPKVLDRRNIIIEW